MIIANNSFEFFKQKILQRKDDLKSLESIDYMSEKYNNYYSCIKQEISIYNLILYLLYNNDYDLYFSDIKIDNPLNNMNYEESRNHISKSFNFIKRKFKKEEIRLHCTTIRFNKRISKYIYRIKKGKQLKVYMLRELKLYKDNKGTDRMINSQRKINHYRKAMQLLIISYLKIEHIDKIKVIFK